MNARLAESTMKPMFRTCRLELSRFSTTVEIVGGVEKTRVTGDEGRSLYRPKHGGSEHSELIAAPECDGYPEALVLRSMESLLGAQPFPCVVAA
jgi:hypothetical protein